jgi:hypothetical protein
MSTVKNFEELQAWQKARVLASYVYALTRKEKFSRDWDFVQPKSRCRRLCHAQHCRRF